MWWCFLITSSYVGSMEDIIWVITCISAIKPVTWPGRPSMVEALFFICCDWWSEWCGVTCVSSILSSLVSAICEMTTSTNVLAFSGVLCNMYLNLSAIFRCVAEGFSIISIFVLLPIPPQYCTLFSFGVDSFSFEFGGGHGCWLLWLNISFNISGKSFPNVERNLSHSNGIGSTWILYLLLICIALILPYVISSSCAFLMLAGSAKLMPPTWLLSAILTLPK